MVSRTQSIWGYETNYGSFADYSVAKGSQLIEKPENMDWVQAGSYLLTLGTAYRMLISENGAQIKNGETCLIWGASGGLGVFAYQICKSAGAVPINVVSSNQKKKYLLENGVENIISLEDFENDKKINLDGSVNYYFCKEFGIRLKELIGIEKVNVVFEHIGKETLPFSIYILDKGGRIVICAATSGYDANVDLRYLWMNVNRIIGSHFCSPKEAVSATKLINEKKISHAPSEILSFNNLPFGLNKIDNRTSFGKIAIKIL